MPNKIMLSRRCVHCRSLPVVYPSQHPLQHRVQVRDMKEIFFATGNINKLREVTWDIGR